MNRAFKKGLAFFLAVTLLIGSGQSIAFASETSSDVPGTKATVLADAVYDDAVSFSDSIAFLQNGTWSDYTQSSGVYNAELEQKNVSANTKIVFMDENGKTITVSNKTANGGTLFDAIYPAISNNPLTSRNYDALKIIKNNKISYIKADGTYYGKQLKYYHFAEPISDELLLVSDDAVTYRIIDSNDKVILKDIVKPSGWTKFISWAGAMLYVNTNDKCYVLSESGQIVSTYNTYMSADQIGNGYTVFKEIATGKSYVYNDSNKLVASFNNKVSNIRATHADKGYLTYGESVQNSSTGAYEYFTYVYNIATGKVVTKINGYASFDGEILIGNKTAGVTSVFNVNGSVYIQDLDAFVTKLAAEEGYKSVSAATYYINGSLLLSLIDKENASKTETFVLTKEDNFKKEDIKKVFGAFTTESQNEEYFVTHDYDGYLCNLAAIDGEVVKNYGKNTTYQYGGRFYNGYQGVTDDKEEFLFAIRVYKSGKVLDGYSYMLATGELSQTYADVDIKGNFLVAKDSANKIFVINGDNELVYTGDGNSEIIDCSHSYRQCISVVKNNRVYLYDRSGVCIFGEDAQYAPFESIEDVGCYFANADDYGEYRQWNRILPNGLLITCKPSGNGYKYGAIKIPDVYSKITSIKNATVKLSKSSYEYTGKAKKPTVTVTLGDKTLKAGTDYSVTYKNNKNIGTATVTVKGKGIYIDSVSKTFKIIVKKGTEYTSGANKYTIINTSTVSFSGVKSKSTKSVKIPKTVKIGGKEFKVTTVAKNALKSNKTIKSISIGENVKTIGASAFNGCKNLATITINSTVLKSVGSKAFKGIAKTAVIKVPTKKYSAYTDLLDGKGQGSKVTIVGNVKKGDAFTASNNKYKVTSSSTVEFNGVKTKKTEVKIPKTVKYCGKTYSVTAIADNALKSNTKVKKVTVGENVKSIGAKAFYGCKNLKTIVIQSKKLKTVEKQCLKGIHAKATIKVPKSKYKDYVNLFNNKGQKSTVKIKTY